MCGIVGYVGKQKAVSILIEGLKRLEYRGYDSAGVAIQQRGGIDIAKKTGRVQSLVKEAARHSFTGTTGISHTRWATHGGVTDANAHPHLSSDGQIALVHNGVVENYHSIKNFLLTKIIPSNPKPIPRSSPTSSPIITPKNPSRLPQMSPPAPAASSKVCAKLSATSTAPMASP